MHFFVIRLLLESCCAVLLHRCQSACMHLMKLYILDDEQCIPCIHMYAKSLKQMQLPKMKACDHHDVLSSTVLTSNILEMSQDREFIRILQAKVVT